LLSHSSGIVLDDFDRVLRGVAAESRLRGGALVLIESLNLVPERLKLVLQRELCPVNFCVDVAGERHGDADWLVGVVATSCFRG